MVSFESFFCLKDVPIMLLFYEIIIIFLIMANLGQCGSMQNTWYIAGNFPLIATFYLAKPENRAINIQYTTHPSCYCFEKRFYFYLKMLTSCKKMLKSAKFRDSWHYQDYFLKPPMTLQLHVKFQVSSIILTSFIQ